MSSNGSIAATQMNLTTEERGNRIEQDAMEEILNNLDILICTREPVPHCLVTTCDIYWATGMISFYTVLKVVRKL